MFILATALGIREASKASAQNVIEEGERLAHLVMAGVITLTTARAVAWHDNHRKTSWYHGDNNLGSSWRKAASARESGIIGIRQAKNGK